MCVCECFSHLALSSHFIVERLLLWGKNPFVEHSHSETKNSSNLNTRYTCSTHKTWQNMHAALLRDTRLNGNMKRTIMNLERILRLELYSSIFGMVCLICGEVLSNMCLSFGIWLFPCSVPNVWSCCSIATNNFWCHRLNWLFITKSIHCLCCSVWEPYLTSD